MHKPIGQYEIDWSHPLASGLVGAWLLDENGGHYVDLTGNNDGIRVGDSFERTLNGGNLGLDFNGNNSTDRIDLGPIDSNNPLSCSATQEFSIISRIDITTSSNLYPRIYDKSNSGLAVGGFCFDIHSNSKKLQIYIDGSDSLNSIIGVPTYLNTVAVAYSKGGEVVFYIDGDRDNAISANLTLPSVTTNAAIGNWNHSIDREFSGFIEYVYVYDRQITDEEYFALDIDPYQLLKPIRTVANDAVYAALFPVSSPGGNTIILNPATETNLSNALSITKNAIISTAVETNAAINLNRQKNRQLNPASETNLSQILSLSKTAQLNVASESDVAQSLSQQQLKTVLPATEIDNATALNFVKIIQINAAQETDQALPTFILSGIALNSASESNQANSLSHAKTVVISPAQEIDSAAALATGTVIQIDVAQETDNSSGLINSKYYALSPASEIDAALNLALTQYIDLMPALEIDQAMVITLPGGQTYLLCDYKLITRIEKTGLLTGIEKTGLLTSICR